MFYVHWIIIHFARFPILEYVDTKRKPLRKTFLHVTVYLLLVHSYASKRNCF